jgi:hypothetical protein
MLIRRKIRESAKGADVAGDVNAAVAANVGERGGVTTASSTQTAKASSAERPR